MIKLISIYALLLLALILPHLPQPAIVSALQSDPQEVLTAPMPVHTTSRFERKLITEVTAITKNTITKDDPDRELDDDVVLSEGKDGQKTTVIEISYYEGKEYSRDIVSQEIVPAQDKVVSHGTKIVWRTIDTSDGSISYWRKLHVWATQYDSHCPGCDSTTAIGLTAGKGVIAVDPTVVKLGSKLYVPGYGEAIAGDTGGAIKGNIIDLGFPDTHTSGWISHFVDIYLQ